MQTEAGKSMDINRIIMIIFAFGAIIGGIDYIIGNKWGYGEEMEHAVKLMPASALGMVGIIAMTPLIAVAARIVIAPVFHLFGIDPGMAGGVLALDMGGYPLAMELAEDQLIGAYSGILVGCIFGCCLVFALPVGMAMIEKDTERDFLQGVIIAIIAMSAGLLVGGLVCGIPAGRLIYQSIPVFLCSLLMIVGLIRFPGKMIAGFQKFTAGLQFVIRLGMVVAVVLYLFGIETEYITPITEGMSTVVNITIVMMGSLPLAKLLQTLLRKPLNALGGRAGLDETACTALLLALVSSVPVFAMLDRMDRRGRVVVSAFTIDCAAILGAHLAYTAANAPEMSAALLACKLTAGILGVVLALIFTRNGAKDGER